MLQESSISQITIELETESLGKVGGLPPNQTTVDRDHRAGHIVGKIGREEFDDLGAILDRSESPKGHQLRAIAVALAATGNNRRHNASGGDHAGRDAVGGDAEWPEILCQIWPRHNGRSLRRWRDRYPLPSLP